MTRSLNGHLYRTVILSALVAWFALALSTFLPTLRASTAPLPVAPVPAASDDPTDVIEPADTLELAGLQSKFEQIARRVSPSVVSISAPWTNPDGADAHNSADMTAQLLEQTLDRTTRTVGTGFAIDRGGFILTNEHVIAGADEIWITTDDRKVMSAVVVGSDHRADLAVLKVPTDTLPPVTFGNTRSLARGQWTIVLGNPLGLATQGEECMSVGVVAATHRSLTKLSTREDRLYTDLVQTTAQINPGSSGGPLFDIDGKVIGIDTAVILPQKQTSGIGFAIPMTPALLDEIRELEHGQRVTYAYLGINVADPTPLQRRTAGISDQAGVVVQSVESQSPASDAALQPGDLILRLGQQLVYDSDQFVRLAGSATVDKPAQLELSRNGKPATALIVPRLRPTDFEGIWQETQHLKWRGMLLGNIPANWSGSGAKPSSGLVVCSIDADSPMKKQGIEAGTIIATVAGRPVGSVIDLLQLVNDLPSDQCVVGTSR